MAISTLNEDRHGLSGEVRLWRGVLEQAVRDIRTTGRNLCRKDIDVRQTRNWIGSQDFFTVCHLAGYEPTATLAFFETIMDPINADH